MKDSEPVSSNEILVNHDHLATFVKEVFTNLGLPKTTAALASDVLVVADLRGVSSHGCKRLANFYVPLLQRGFIDIKAQLSVVQSQITLKCFNANAGLGLGLAPQAMMVAMDIAKQCGIGLVGVANSSHFGIASYYTLKAVEAGMIGIALTNGYPAVAPTGYENALLGTNSISVACPSNNLPLVIDMAMSATSLGYLEEMVSLNKPVPAYLAADRLRNKMNVNIEDEINPSEIVQNRMVAPLGSRDGRIGEYKGFVLSLIIELLTAIFPGGQMSFQLKRGGACHFFVVINPEILGSPLRIEQMFAELSQKLENTPFTSGYPRYRIPGYVSNQIQIERLKKGIPLHFSTINALSKLADKLNIDRIPIFK